MTDEEPTFTRRHLLKISTGMGTAAAVLSGAGKAIKGNQVYDSARIPGMARSIVSARASKKTMTPEEIIDAYEAEKLRLSKEATPASALDVVTTAAMYGGTAYGIIKTLERDKQKER